MTIRPQVACAICGQPVELLAGILIHNPELTNEELKQRGLPLHTATLFVDKPQPPLESE